ncbi:hypothetical protein ACEPPN_010303 [Leptodophora sp. 'Broadleaf-Isolate-01']
MSEETVLAMTQSSIDLHPRQSISLAGNTTPVMQLETFHTEEEDVANHSRRHTKLQLATIMSMLYFSVFLAALDTTITTTALPTIASYFNASAGYTWLGSAYLLATAASTPSWGKISDIFGRKPALLASLALFFLGSLICGIASSMTMLNAGRAVQGTGGGGMLILVHICTSDLFSMR